MSGRRGGRQGEGGDCVSRRRFFALLTWSLAAGCRFILLLMAFLLPVLVFLRWLLIFPCNVCEKDIMGWLQIYYLSGWGRDRLLCSLRSGMMRGYRMCVYGFKK